jgi:leader peptidase (prepilin peptidase)/N-methyltransferase
MLILIILAIYGLIFGSFINALVWRLKKKKNYVRARSQCPDCGHSLAAKDLVPVFSWLLLGGRCRYCQKTISVQYPLVELAAALVFTLSYTFWPANFDSVAQKVLFISWLGASVGLLALLVYDLKWMLLPNKLIYPTLALAAAGNLIYLILADDRTSFALNWAGSVAVASGLFWVLFVVSKGKWIGYGDVRLGLITGTLLHSPANSFLMIFLASILGTLFVLPSLLRGGRKLSARLPYGPFLIVSAWLCLLFGKSLLDWYLNSLRI